MTDHGFHRWVNPAGRSAPGTYEIEASEADRASVARWLDIPGIRRLSASLRLRRESADAVEVTGSFTADVDLVCGVTLETFPQKLGGEIEATFRKDAAAPEAVLGADVEISLDSEEPRPWTVQGVDLGALLAEELSLAMPDFPRKPGVDLSRVEGAPQDELRPNPFAVLAKLPRPAPES